jgi:hypothetical protein
MGGLLKSKSTQLSHLNFDRLLLLEIKDREGSIRLLIRSQNASTLMDGYLSCFAMR